MKKYWFIVTLISGVTFAQYGEGMTKDAALMDACINLNALGVPEDDVKDINLTNNDNNNDKD